MRERIYYILALAVLIIAIVGLVLIVQQNQPTVSQDEVETSTQDFQALFITLQTRMEADALYEFRLRHSALAEGGVVTISQSETRLVEAGEDYFCLANNTTDRFCYSYNQLLVVAFPE